MRTAYLASACSLSLLLAACGGSDTNSQAHRPAPLAMRSAQLSTATQHAPDDYRSIVQSIYIGFFGRPADFMGMNFWSQAFSDKNLPLTLPELIAGYASDPNIKSVLDGFVQSREFQQQYVANNASFINAVYLNAFNRNADAGGLDFWSGFLQRGQITPAQAVLWILNGAQNDDAVIVAKKTQLASTFTDSLDTGVKVDTYMGDWVDEGARQLLGGVTAGTDTVAFKPSMDAFIDQISSATGSFHAVAYYVGYRNLQDMSNTPAYAARDVYIGYVSGIVPSGQLVYGVQAQRVNWTRTDSTNYVYEAPFTSSMSLASASFDAMPAVTMLCQSQPAASGSTLKSTDVLVSRDSLQLLDASQLAGQTFAIYRENCALGGGQVSSLAFDAKGGVNYGGTVLDAAAVTSLLKGGVITDPLTGKYLAFAAYRYTGADKATRNFIVQHEGDQMTNVSDGSLAIWTQE